MQKLETWNSGVNIGGDDASGASIASLKNLFSGKGGAVWNVLSTNSVDKSVYTA